MSGTSPPPAPDHPTMVDLATSPFPYRRQPAKALYIAYFALSALLVRIPYWLLTASIPALRPRRDWPFKRAFMVPLMRATVRALFAVGFPAIPDPADVRPTPRDVERGFVAVPPVPDDLVVGEVREMARVNGVEPRATYGYWYTAAGVQGRGDHPARDGELVVLNFHGTSKFHSPSYTCLYSLHAGGGYCLETPSPSGFGAPGVCAGLLAHGSPRLTRVFAGAYRLVAAAPFARKNAFPAALLDALAAYRHLVHAAGFAPARVVVAGDSAGGHLALALVRYLAGAALPALPPPGALVLASPAVEWAVTHDGEGSSWRANWGTDICMPFFETEYTARGLVGNLPAEAARTNAWISPASRELAEGTVEGLFGGLPRTLVIVGGCETQRDSMRTFRDRLVKDIGEEQVKYVEIEGATHDVIGVPWYDDHSEAAFRTIGDWIASL